MRSEGQAEFWVMQNMYRFYFIVYEEEKIPDPNKVLSLLEGCFDLLSSPSPFMKVHIMGQKISENLGI